MKKVIVVILSLCFVLLYGCSLPGNILNVSIDYGKSDIYSQKDMDSAINVIKNEFLSYKGCELHSITYTSDRNSKNNVSYCNELKKGVGYDECIVFRSSFHSPKNDTHNGWNTDSEYSSWGWYLARKDKGEWTLVGSGQG